MKDSRKCEEGGQMIMVNTWQHVAISHHDMEITSQIFSLAAGKRDYSNYPFRASKASRETS
jgi:hypothetical protein